jgi:hypothetical protein
VTNKGKHSEPLPPRPEPPRRSSRVSARGQEREGSGGARGTSGRVQRVDRERSNMSSDDVTASDDKKTGDGFDPAGTFLGPHFLCSGGLRLLGSYSMWRTEMPMLPP